MAYVTAADAERELPVDATDLGLTDAEWDALLSDLLDSASNIVDTWTDTAFELTTASLDTHRFEGDPNEDLPLPKRPIDSVQAVTAETRTDSYTLTPGEDFHVHETHLELTRDAPIASWPTTTNAVSVDWTYGSASVPAAVHDAVIRLVRGKLDAIVADGVESEKLSDGSSVSYRVPNEVRAAARIGIAAHVAPSYYGGASLV